MPILKKYINSKVILRKNFTININITLADLWMGKKIIIS